MSETPSQTAGPYVHIGLAPLSQGLRGPDLGARIAGDGARGRPLTLTGRITDGAGAPVTDAVVELWQADALGLHPSPEEPRGEADARMAGWGRAATDEDGRFVFETIHPGPVPGPGPGGPPQAPHVTLWIVARGVNVGLRTRAYFEGDDLGADPLLAALGPERAATLIARRVPGGHHIDVRLQGEGETVFLEV